MVGGFGEHDAADPRVLQEAVGAAVAAHRDMADRVDPQPRLQARRDGEVEQVDVGRHLGKDRREFGGQEVKPHAACLAQFDDDVVAIGGRVLHVADGVGKAPTEPIGFTLSPASLIAYGSSPAGLVKELVNIIFLPAHSRRC